MHVKLKNERHTGIQKNQTIQYKGCYKLANDKNCVMTRIMEMEMKKRQAGTKYRFYIKWKDLYIYSFSSMLIESGISKRLNPIG